MSPSTARTIRKILLSRRQRRRGGDASFEALGAEQSLGVFAAINGCGARRDVKDPRTHGVILTFSGCKAPTVLFRLERAGHHVAGHVLENGDSSADYFDANRAVWDFLKRGGALNIEFAQRKTVLVSGNVRAIRCREAPKAMLRKPGGAPSRPSESACGRAHFDLDQIPHCKATRYRAGD